MPGPKPWSWIESDQTKLETKDTKRRSCKASSGSDRVEVVSGRVSWDQMAMIEPKRSILTDGVLL